MPTVLGINANNSGTLKPRRQNRLSKVKEPDQATLTGIRSPLKLEDISEWSRENYPSISDSPIPESASIAEYDSPREALGAIKAKRDLIGPKIVGLANVSITATHLTYDFAKEAERVGGTKETKIKFFGTHISEAKQIIRDWLRGE